MSQYATMSQRELDALMKEIRAAKKDAHAREKARKDAERKALHDALRDSFTLAGADVVEHTQFRESENSDWAGYTVSGVQIELEGVTYTVGITLTDVVRKKERKLQRELDALTQASDESAQDEDADEPADESDED